MNTLGLWNDEDGFYSDVLHMADGRRTALAGDRDRAVARTEVINVELIPPGGTQPGGTQPGGTASA